MVLNAVLVHEFFTQTIPDRPIKKEVTSMPKDGFYRIYNRKHWFTVVDGFEFSNKGYGNFPLFTTSLKSLLWKTIVLNNLQFFTYYRNTDRDMKTMCFTNTKNP